ncbi:MAG TPA: hypothetical protein VM328_06980, partial [Fimbriimonadaceae bacterium]|nr:hypothetical protein [Fimbriimonadaceae bacterium]
MNMSAFKWCVLALAGSFVVSGCGSKGGVYQPKPAKGIPVAKVSPGEEASLMPLVVGNQWVYEMAAQLTAPNGQRETRSGVIVYTVKSVKPNATGDGKIATIEVRGENAEKVGDVQVWEINKKGIFQRSISLKNVPFEPMLPAIVFPVETGRTFTWEGSG